MNRMPTDCYKQKKKQASFNTENITPKHCLEWNISVWTFLASKYFKPIFITFDTSSMLIKREKQLGHFALFPVMILDQAES